MRLREGKETSERSASATRGGRRRVETRRDSQVVGLDVSVNEVSRVRVLDSGDLEKVEGGEGQLDTETRREG